MNIRQNTNNIFGFLFQFLFLDKLQFLLAISLFAIGGIIEPYFITKIYATVLGIIKNDPNNINLENIKYYFLLYLGFWFIQNVAYFLGYLFYGRVVSLVEKESRLFMFKTIQNIKYSFFLKEGEGSITRSMEILSSNLIIITQIIVRRILPALIVFCVIFYEFCKRGYSFGLIIIAWLLVNIFIIVYYTPLFENITSSQTKIHQEINNFCVDTLKNQKINYFFNLNNFNFKNLSDLQTKDRNMHITALATIRGIKFFKTISSIVFQGIVMNTLIFFLLQNKIISFEDFIFLVQLNGSLIHLIYHTTDIIPEIIYSLKRASSVLRFFHEDLRDTQPATKLSILHEQGKISLEDISFSFGDNQIFKNFSFEISPKKKILIMGYSGIGKSTLISLISGLINTYEGDIFIDGINSLNLRKSCRNNYFSYLFNDGIVSGSLLDNIAIGDKFPNTEYVQELMKKLNINHEITDQILTSNNKLSQGEKQRILIARGLYNKNSKVVVCDEPFRGLDFKNKKNAKDLILDFVADKTFIAVDHDLTLIDHVDTVLFFNNDNQIVIDTPPNILINPDFKNFIHQNFHEDI